MKCCFSRNTVWQTTQNVFEVGVQFCLNFPISAFIFVDVKTCVYSIGSQHPLSWFVGIIMLLCHLHDLYESRTCVYLLYHDKKKYTFRKLIL